MVATRDEAFELAGRVRAGLEEIYGGRLCGVYLYGSAVRGELRADSDLDIAIVLDEIVDRFAEHERVSELGARLSLEASTVISFLFVSRADFEAGSFAVHRAIKSEGVLA